MTENEEFVTVEVPIRKVDESGLVSNWDDDTFISLSVMGGNEPYVAISANRAGLQSLARHLLTLAQPEARDGYNLYWEPTSGWFDTDDLGLHISLVSPSDRPSAYESSSD